MIALSVRSVRGADGKKSFKLMSRTSLDIGDRVRVFQVPPSVMSHTPEETQEIFRRCVGQVLRVDGFGDHGHLELNVKDDGSQSAGYCDHTIWIEPEYVEYVDALGQRADELEQ